MGEKKYNIFSQSKVVLHPAFYDSGGMASAEEMAFGLPAIGFNLKAYESYYPKGMIRVPLGSINKFSQGILGLLEDFDFRRLLGDEAAKMIRLNRSWKKRSRYLFRKMKVI